MRLKGLVLFFSLISYSSIAQTDLGLWSGAEFFIPLNKKIEFSAEGQLRWEDNISKIGKLFVATGAEYRIDKHIRASFNYRLSGNTYNSTYNNKVLSHRFTVDMNFRELNELFTDKSDLDITVRLRWTNEHQDYVRTDNNLRGRIKLSYEIAEGLMTPFAACEWFYQFNDQIHYTSTEVISHNGISKYRLKFGSSFKLSENHRMKLFMNYQRGIADDAADVIIGVGYSIQLDRILD